MRAASVRDAGSDAPTVTDAVADPEADRDESCQRDDEHPGQHRRRSARRRGRERAGAVGDQAVPVCEFRRTRLELVTALRQFATPIVREIPRPAPTPDRTDSTW